MSDRRRVNPNSREFIPRAPRTAPPGHRSDPLWRAWVGMKSRCKAVPPSKWWASYGAKGISYDPRWHTFAGFAEDMGPHPGPAFTLDRRDNSKGYSKDNCRWATRREQVRNRDNNVLTAPAVVEIRRRYEIEKLQYRREKPRSKYGPRVLTSLAQEFGTTRKHVWAVVNDLLWKKGTV